MVTIEQIKEFLLNQDLFEREVDEIIKNLNIELKTGAQSPSSTK